MNHDEAVTKHFEIAENTLDDGYWQGAFREINYYEDETSPHPPHPEDKGNQKGEFDVLLVNYDDRIAFYKEIKTSHGDMFYAKKQLERAKEHFEDTDWELIGNRYLED